MRSARWSLISLFLVACGGTQAPRSVSERVTIDPPIFLAEIGTDAAPTVFAYPTRTVESLEAARRGARGEERRSVGRELAVALMFAADEAEGREARRLRQRAERTLDAAARGNRDSQLAAQLDFIRLWMSWRSGSSARTARLAQRYATRHRAAGILTTLAYMLQGEVAMAEEDHDDAIEAYRYALGQLGTPLYAYALYRTAHAHGAAGDRDAGIQALQEVERLGCDSSAEPTIVRIASAAASDLETGLRQGSDDVIRPASCPTPSAADEEEEEGWRPAE